MSTPAEGNHPEGGKAPGVVVDRSASSEKATPSYHGQATIYDAEAHGALLRAAGHATALGNVLVEAAYAIDATDRGALARDVRKVTELHRLVAARLAGAIRALEVAS